MQKKIRSTNVFLMISMIFFGLLISPAVLAEEYTFVRGKAKITIDVDYNNNVMKVKYTHPTDCPKGETVKSPIPGIGGKTKVLVFKCGAEIQVFMNNNQQGIHYIEFKRKGWKDPIKLYPRSKPKSMPLFTDDVSIVQIV